MSAEKFSYNGDRKAGSYSGRAGVAVVAAAVLLAGGCSGGGETPQHTSASPPAAASTRSPGATHPTAPVRPGGIHTSASRACRLPGAGFETSIRTSHDTVQLSRFMIGKSVDMAPHTTNGECYDQVTFRFGGQRKSGDPLPGVHARYVSAPVRQKPSDIAVKVAGNAFIEVDIGTWWYKAGGGEGPRTVTDPDVRNVQVAQQTQNFEGTSTWVVGVAEKQPFAIAPVSGTPGCPDLCFALKVQSPAS